MQHGGPNGRRWTMLMVAGGHFAGLVAQVRRPDEAEAEEEPSGGKGKKKKLKPKPEVEVIMHKTFHRYTSQLVHTWFTIYSHIWYSTEEARRVAVCE
jgi:ankyrin repeat and zinc finger domain-containing protein 1